MNTTQLLAPLCVALGVLVWLDNSGPEDSGGSSSSVVGAIERHQRATDTTVDAPSVGQSEAPSGASAAATGNPLADVDKADLSATVERPLFAPQRSRPPVAAEEHEEVAAPPPPPPPSYELLGVVTHDGRAIALLSRAEDGTSFRVEVGDTVGGWQVSSVEPKSVRLTRQDGTTRTVPLSDARPKPQPMTDLDGME